MTLNDLLTAVAIAVVVFSAVFTAFVLLTLLCEKLVDWAGGLEG